MRPLEVKPVEVETKKIEQRESILTPDRQAEIMSLDSRIQTLNNIVNEQKKYSPVDRDVKKEKEIEKAREQIKARLETNDLTVKKENGKVFINEGAFSLFSQNKVNSIDGKNDIEILPIKSDISKDMLKKAVVEKEKENVQFQKGRVTDLEKLQNKNINILNSLTEDYKEIDRRITLQDNKSSNTKEKQVFTNLLNRGGFSSEKTNLFEKGGLTENIINKDISTFKQTEQKYITTGEKLKEAKIDLFKRERVIKARNLLEGGEVFNKEISAIYNKARFDSSKNDSTLLKGVKFVSDEIPILRNLVSFQKEQSSIRNQLSIDYGLSEKQIKDAQLKVGRGIAKRGLIEGGVIIASGAGAELVGRAGVKTLLKVGARALPKTISKAGAVKGLTGTIVRGGSRFITGAVGVAPAGALEGALLSANQQILLEGGNIKALDKSRLKSSAKLGALSAGVISGTLGATAGTKFGKLLDVGSDIVDPTERVSDAYADILSSASKRLKSKVLVRGQSTTSTQTNIDLKKTIQNAELSFKLNNNVFTKSDNLRTKLRVKPKTKIQTFVKTEDKTFEFTRSSTSSKPNFNIKNFVSPKINTIVPTKPKPMSKPNLFVKSETTSKSQITPFTQTSTKTKVRDDLFAPVGAGLFFGGFGIDRFNRKKRAKGEIKFRKLADLFSKSFKKK